MKKNALKKNLTGFPCLYQLAIVLAVCALFVIFPEESKLALSVVRGFLGDDFACIMHFWVLELLAAHFT